MLQKITINEYRRLSDFSAALKPLNVLIGRNSVGKTSFLEVLRLMSSSAQSKLGSTISSLGGYSSIATLSGNEEVDYTPSNFIAFEIEYLLQPDNQINYQFGLLGSGIGYVVDLESMTSIHDKRKRTFIETDPTRSRISVDARNRVHDSNGEFVKTETRLSQIQDKGPVFQRFKEALSSISYYHAIETDTRSPVRFPQPIRPTNTPGEHGEDLISCLYNVRETDRDRFNIIQDTLKVVFPEFERIDFPPVAAGTLAMTWKDKRFSRPVYSHQLSDGTLRFLWLTVLLYSPSQSAITLIDEPETSLHPQMLSLLAQMFREASQYSQIIIATQSDALVRFMQPQEVLVMDLDDDGHTTAEWADEMQLGDWLEDYTLDQLWRIGRLGGR
jgi:predicted ATPase